MLRRSSYVCATCIDSLMASMPNLWPAPMPYISCQCLLSMPGSTSISGYLEKRSLSSLALARWQIRFTVVFNGCIYYYKSSSSPRPQGAFSLKGYNRVLRSDDESAPSAVFPFKIMSFSKKKRIWHFSTPNDFERKRWMLGIRQEIKRYCILVKAYRATSIDSSEDSSSVYSALEKPVNIRLSQDSGLQLIGLDDIEDYDYDENEEDLAPPTLFFDTSEMTEVESKVKRCNPRNGLYCIRRSSHGGQVLMVWEESSKKMKNFRIYKDTTGDLSLDNSSSQRFSCLPELFAYYVENVLPNQKRLRLQCPF
uniref:SH3 domain-binding protein 2-like n=1 Tax=Myxine glutinosa TaxID=7769 RepID=UPI00358F981A